MSTRTILIGVLALTFGASAAVGVNIVYHQQPAMASGDISEIVVATRDVPRGTVLSADFVKTREFPKALAPAGAVTKLEDVLDRFVLHSLVKDEPVMERKLSAKHAKGGLAGLVSPGMRAFTIQTPHVATHVAGFILPGNKVDVLLTMSGLGGPNDKTGGGVTTTLLQNVEVLAVDQRLDAPTENRVDPRNLQSVTLLVTPDQAAKLELGQNKGTLHLTLRNPEDQQAARTQPATLSGLQFYQEKPFLQQAKEVIEAFARARADSAVRQPPARPAAPEDITPSVVEIRTVRGTFSNVVPVELQKPRDGGR